MGIAVEARKSSVVAAVEDSLYAQITSNGTKSIIDKAIDSYLKDRKFETEEDFAVAVNALRRQFSTPSKIAELKGRSEQGYNIYLSR